MTDRLRLGLIGVGTMGRHHLRVLSGLADVMVVAIADPDPERRAAVAALTPARLYADYGELLDRERVEAVVVATPTRLHAPVTLAALAAGAHVLVEKPIAATRAEAEAMIAAARQAGRLLTVGHIERFNPAVQLLQRHLQERMLGRLYQVHARRLGPFPARIRDVGVVVDLATHDLDLIRFLTGQEVVHLLAETAQHIHTQYEDLLVGLLRLTDGAIGLLEVNWLTPTKVREIILTGERGMFHVDLLRQELVFYENEHARLVPNGHRPAQISAGNSIRFHLEPREPLQVELEAFCRAVRESLPPPVSPADALVALDLARALVAAAQTGSAISPTVLPMTR